jgi:radical SAM superfamily enzyme YgiQ (UPF0313 family)
VGISCQTALVYSSLELASMIKKIRPGTFIVAGGVHPSIRPLDLLYNGDIDIVVRGEGEETFAEIVKRWLANIPVDNVAGTSLIAPGGGVRNNPKRPLAKDIDVYPMPALDLVPLDKYRISPDLRTGDRFGMVLTARGCPYDCIFCANKLLTERTYRARSVKSVIDEIEYYLKTTGVTQLMIIDDNFTVNRKRTIELCEEFIRRGYPDKFNWWAEARVDCLDQELLNIMKKAGCSILSLGLESGNQRLLDLIKKNITLEKTKEAVKMIKRSGIKSRASFILGLPTETKQETINTIKFAYGLPIDQVRFAIATPFPGTVLWDIAVKEGRVDPTNIDWTKLSLMGGYTDHDPMYYPEGRTAKEMKSFQKTANLMFYLRPSIIFGFLGRIKSPSDLKHMFKGLFYLLRSSFSK